MSFNRDEVQVLFLPQNETKMTELEEKLIEENKELKRQLSKFYSVDLQGATPHLPVYLRLSLEFNHDILEHDFMVEHLLRDIVHKMYNFKKN